MGKVGARSKGEDPLSLNMRYRDTKGRRASDKKKYMKNTYLIDRKGRIRKKYRFH